MTILAAVGGQHEEDRVIEVAYDLATTYGDELVVLHVMAQEQFEELRDSANPSGPVVVAGVDEASGIAYRDSGQSTEEYNIEDAIEDAKSVGRECVSRTVGDDHGIDVSYQARVGDPATEITKVGEEIDARFLVVGGRKRSPTGKAIFGSVSQSVILDSTRPVVTITR
jgi:nucleotide-binding universal stress UspA family protein